MRSSSRRMHAGRVSAVAALTVLAVAAGFAATRRADSQDKKTPAPASAAETFVGVWHATLPNGLSAGALTVVPAGGGVGGAFIGYDYDRRLDPDTPVGGAPPKVAIRSGGVFTNAALDGKTLTFAMQLRLTTPRPARPSTLKSAARCAPRPTARAS